MPRPNALPKGNALIRRISLRGDQESTAHKANALIRNTAISFARGYEQMGAGPRQPLKGSTVNDAIEIDDDEDDIEVVNGPAPTVNGSAHGPVPMPPIKPDADIEITGVKAEITVVRAIIKTEPDATFSIQSTNPTRPFRANPLSLQPGRADQPILLDSDSENELTVPAVRRTRSRSRDEARAQEEALLQMVDEVLLDIDRQQKEREVGPPVRGAGNGIARKGDLSDENGSINEGRRPCDAESSKFRTSRSIDDLRDLSLQRKAEMKMERDESASTLDVDDSSSESDDWESYHAGFPSIQLPPTKKMPRTDAKMHAANLRKAEQDARAADRAAALEDQLRRKDLGVLTETVHPTREVLAVYFDRRGQSIQPPEFLWDCNDVAPPLSLSRMPNVLMNAAAGSGSCRRQLASRGERRSMRVVKQLVGTSGAIWSTDQSRNGTIAIAASAVAGDESYLDINNEYSLNAYNKDGNVSIWRKPEDELEEDESEQSPIAEVTSLSGHVFRDVLDPALGAQRPHYATVFSVAFDPLSDDSFISCGADATVRRWDISDDEGRHRNTSTWRYPKHPHHLMFHGKEHMFAVGASDGCVYIHSGQDYVTQYFIRGNEDERQVSSMRFGSGSTRQMLFFATEHPSDENNDGEAYAVDYASGESEPLYQFAEVSGGDGVLALDSTGSRLAIVAGDREHRSRQSLFLYEPQMLDGEKVLECRLPEFDSLSQPPSMSEGCHTMDVQFSPCGTYIAIARDNNCALIYDIRNAALPLHVFGHVTYSREDMESRFGIRGGEKATYGIASLGWIGHDTLITGGADGCVRRWNTSMATKRMGGAAIARLDQPVSHLSFPTDTLQYRYPLIAGDMEGKIYVFDYDVGLEGGRMS